MKKLFCQYGHWVLFIVLGVIVISNFFYYKPYNTADIVALAFGLMGLIGVLYLAIVTEKKKRNKKND
ncbi:hypothetical protein ACSVDE_03260 [Pseudalkalibacillus sp. Hm43]|uniref:hypothetical protein n=1 Tax=Pseudalkalibacillus sp. Hm43 TaxID=3450742 RepID=UPI003F43D4BE